jgi:fructokinase
VRQLSAIPGGSPANVAVGLARLGVPTAFAGRLSRGGFGPWLSEHLLANGVDLAPSVETEELATLAVVALDAGGRASYTFYGPGTADWQWRRAELAAPSDLRAGGSTVAAVHTGSLAVALEPGASVLGEWLAEVRAEGRALVSIDPNVRPSFVGDLGRYREKLEKLLGCAHLVKASSEDLEVIAPGTGPLDVVDSWLAAGAYLVVMTHGPEGASAFHRSGWRARCQAPAVKVADTIGAGDAFSAGLLAYLATNGLLSPGALAGLAQGQLDAALAQAVAVSAITCTRAGADPPNAAELTTFLGREVS